MSFCLVTDIMKIPQESLTPYGQYSRSPPPSAPLQHEIPREATPLPLATPPRAALLHGAPLIYLPVLVPVRRIDGRHRHLRAAAQHPAPARCGARAAAPRPSRRGAPAGHTPPAAPRQTPPPRHFPAIAAAEAAIPDTAALVFACLGIALALHGRRALRA